MKIRILQLVVILFTVIAIIFLFARDYETMKKEKIDSIIEEKYAKWYEEENKTVNFDHPYVKWIIDRKGSGTFGLNLDIEYNVSSDEVNSELNKLGIIDNFECYESLKECSIELKIKDFDIIKKLFTLYFIQDVHITFIESDYKINVSIDKMKKCNNDSECAMVRVGCCGCNTESMNKEYVNLWNSQFYCYGSIACIAVACEYDPLYPVCQENICVLKSMKVCETNKDCIATEEKNCINKSIFEKFNYIVTDIFNCRCENNNCMIIPNEVSDENETEKDTTPLIINITQPIYGSNVTTGSVYITAITNKRAICQYIEDIEEGNESEFRQMNITNGTFHSQLIENLQDGGRYTVRLNCTDELGNLSVGSVEFRVRTLMPDEYYPLRRTLTKSELPNLLKDGQIKYVDTGREIIFTQALLIGSIRLENSTSNGDLDSPKVLIEVGTDPHNYLYQYNILFSNNVNFTRTYGGTIEMVGEKYMISEESTNQKIILNKKGSDSNIILENNQPVKINNKIINGTYVELDNKWGSVAQIYINFVMQDPKKDYIAVGESYDDPIFQNIRLAFKSYSEEEGTEIYIGSVRDY